MFSPKGVGSKGRHQKFPFHSKHDINPLGMITCPTLWKSKLIFPSSSEGDMLVPRRVKQYKVYKALRQNQFDETWEHDNNTYNLTHLVCYWFQHISNKYVSTCRSYTSPNWGVTKTPKIIEKKQKRELGSYWVSQPNHWHPSIEG